MKKYRLSIEFKTSNNNATELFSSISDIIINTLKELKANEIWPTFELLEEESEDNND